MKVKQVQLGAISGMVIIAGFVAYKAKIQPSLKLVVASADPIQKIDPLMSGKWIIDDTTDKIGRRSVSLQHIGRIIGGSPKRGVTILDISDLSISGGVGHAISIILPIRVSLTTPIFSLRFDEDEIIQVPKLQLIESSTVDPTQEWLTLDGESVVFPMAQYGRYIRRFEAANKLRVQYGPLTHEGLITLEFDVRGFSEALVEYKTKVSKRGK